MNNAGRKDERVQSTPSWDEFAGLGEEIALGDLVDDRFLMRERERIFDSHSGTACRLQLNSLDALAAEWQDVLHYCRVICDFDKWRNSPGQEKLFKDYCSLAVADWDLSELSAKPPTIFTRGSETVEQHLSHCSFCWLVRRLAQGKRRQIQNSLADLLRGDQLVADLVRPVIKDALFCAKSPATLDQSLIPSGGASEPTALVLSRSAGHRLNGDLVIPAQLTGGAAGTLVEMNVTWELTIPDSSIRTSTLAFPNREQVESAVELSDQGCGDICVVVPNEAAKQGVVFKFCGRQMKDLTERKLRSYSAKVRTRGVRAKGVPSGHRGPNRQVHEPVGVQVGATSFIADE